MKHLELLKFPTYKASFSFDFSSNFYSLVCSLSPLGGTFISMGTVIVGEAEQDPHQWFETNFTKWSEGGNRYCFSLAYVLLSDKWLLSQYIDSVEAE